MAGVPEFEEAWISLGPYGLAPVWLYLCALDSSTVAMVPVIRSTGLGRGG